MRLFWAVRKLHLLWLVLALLAALVFFLEVVADVGGSAAPQRGMPLDSGPNNPIPTVPASPVR